MKIFKFGIWRITFTADQPLRFGVRLDESDSSLHFYHISNSVRFLVKETSIGNSSIIGFFVTHPIEILSLRSLSTFLHWIVSNHPECIYIVTMPNSDMQLVDLFRYQNFQIKIWKWNLSGTEVKRVIQLEKSPLRVSLFLKENSIHPVFKINDRAFEISMSRLYQLLMDFERGR